MKANRQIRRDARKLFRFCFQEGRLDAIRARGVAEKIIESKHRGYVALLWQFHRLVKLECDRYSAEVASAAPLQRDLREAIAADLESLYGARLEIRFVENPELIGGVRVLVGNDVYDDSVRYRLTQLQKSFSVAGGW